MSVGGVVGGAFNAFLAPMIFTVVIEYPLVLVLAVFARPFDPIRMPLRSWILLAVAVLAALAAVVVTSVGDFWPVLREISQATGNKMVMVRALLGAGASTAGVPGAPQHRKTPLDSILLNGAGIAVLVPGSDGPEEGRDAAIGPTSG